MPELPVTFPESYLRRWKDSDFYGIPLLEAEVAIDLGVADLSAQQRLFAGSE